MKFKTNANCGGCCAKIIKSLEPLAPADMWDFDLTSADKVLTYKGNSLVGKENEVISLIEGAGFKAELLCK